MALPTITINNSGGTTQYISERITGETNHIKAGSVVSIFENGGATSVNTAKVRANGTWAAEVTLTQKTTSIVARVNEPAGPAVTSNEADFTFEPVLSPPANGSPPQAFVEPLHPNAKGLGHVVSSYAPNLDFVFGPAPGQVLITASHLTGCHLGEFDLPRLELTSIASVLHAVQDSGQGIEPFLGNRSSATSGCMTITESRVHPQDFRIHF